MTSGFKSGGQRSKKTKLRCELEKQKKKAKQNLINKSQIKLCNNQSIDERTTKSGSQEKRQSKKGCGAVD